ncbi:MAG: dTMP kinase [Clostridiales bacterium]|nr:dTMP kinase [Candidatus Apopatousia equi]
MKNFITFEGGEGCGKTTLIQGLKEYCEKNNIPCLTTREPGGIKECEEIRTVLKTSKELSPKTQLLLFSACRSHLTEKLIKPSLMEGKIVFCDRYFDSTRVYQGYCGNLDDDFIMDTTKKAVGDVMPQITFFLDIDPEFAFKRKGGEDKGDVFEEAGIEFHKKVREGFKYLCKKEPERFRTIDATKSIDEVRKEVIEILKKEKVICD